MKRTGWIIYNGNLPGSKFLDFAEMLQKAAEKFNSKAKLIKNNDLLSLLTTSKLDVLSEMPLPDYVVFTDKDIYLAKQLEYLGVPVFNKAEVIAVSDDKIATYQALAKLNLPIPKTIIAPKIFHTGSFDERVIEMAIEEIGFPLIMKEAFGSFGEQVYLVESKKELNKKLELIGNKPFVFQEFVRTSYGVDLRLQVVGNKVVAAMKRKSDNDFRANITAGGRMEAYTPTQSEEEIAVLATEAIGADFAGVDLLYGEENQPIICEINSNAHIRNLYECTGINAADYMMEYVLNKIKDY
ncbi:ATP-grasp domain-containing protein [Oceanobacillus alkalisoli]|uniref:ATP-grasp domain-containing protein n=1 Tax=Oceanobacillus alkalisoli TaxID=2925113 RepID=UPI001EEFF78C|nr:RimK family alpha-L-glutamate ligase [Oceanobacillus alkalisoli]MCF3941896.1 RimK family alpha-L-glutamate ligase [Oceanobacillus alkalisoli]MCG5104271.1 RimK family alpha-L-glutamate ligase [Oceanobacillus alkalisoli]